MLLCDIYSYEMNRLIAFGILLGLLACKNEKKGSEQVEVVNSGENGMLLIPAGTFMMGGKIGSGRLERISKE